MRRISLKKKVLFSFIVLLAFYATIEILASVVAYHTWWGDDFWFFEDAGRTIQFDAVRGYRLTTTPSRVIGISHGIVEYVGTLRGNCQGFPDRDDFWPKRPQGSVRRIAVFGDSFTAAQYLGQNWPDRAEDLAREAAKPIELLNFAVYAGGLANWHRVLFGIVDFDRYEIDGLIFAVYGNDLWRTFYLAEDRGAKQYMQAFWPSWNPATIPATLEGARPYLRPADHSYILTPEEFERPLQGQWPRSVPRSFKPILLTMAWRSALPYMPRICRLALADQARLTGHAPLDLAPKYRDVRIQDIKRFCEARHLPTTVVYIPDRAELLGGDRVSQAFAEARDFAETLGAIFLDGREIFEGMSRAEIRAHYFPYNGHWNQLGSNRFAEFVVRRLCLPEGQPDGSEGARTAKRCTVESQGPSTVRTAEVVGRRDTDAGRLSQ
jgi:hypothetical protein